MEQDGKLTINNTIAGKGLVVGGSTITTNQAAVLIKGTLAFAANALWEHKKSGFYAFTSSHTLNLPSSVNVTFAGLHKTHKMLELNNRNSCKTCTPCNVSFTQHFKERLRERKIDIDLNDININRILGLPHYIDNGCYKYLDNKHQVIYYIRRNRNGFKLENYIFQDSFKGPLGWVGRVAPEKGLEDAVYVANELGEKLKVWGVIEDEAYASKIEQSFPQGTIDWMGFLSTNELQKGLGKCRVLLNTPKWNEAYGNVVVEALACGVPVIAYRRGGPSEIIQHGQTGYLANPEDKKNMLYFVEIIEKIKRKKCREWVEKNASTDIFANKVVNWLNKVIDESK